MRVIGLTGGVATGKSTVARILGERGIPVVDADVAARAVVAPGSDGLAAVVDAFGEAVLLPDGGLDRRAMRDIVFADPAARRTLEAITHPRIAAAMAAELASLAAAGTPLAFVEAALMVETGSYKHYSALWVVSCSASRQLARLMARDRVTEGAARAIVAAQLPLADKEAVADVVIRNDGTYDELAAAVGAALDRAG
jgi:dephospho-CoA kinase